MKHRLLLIGAVWLSILPAAHAAGLAVPAETQIQIRLNNEISTQTARIKDGVEVAIDGNPAALIDLSAVGAQVVSATVLKPNQRVRVVIGDAKNQVKCAGAVAWAAFEMPKGMPTRYRAGIDFGTAADGAGLDAFGKKNKKE